MHRRIPQALLGEHLYIYASNIWPVEYRIQKNNSETTGTTKVTLPQKKQRILDQLDFSLKDNVIEVTEINQPIAKRAKLNFEDAKPKAGWVT